MQNNNNLLQKNHDIRETNEIIKTMRKEILSDELLEAYTTLDNSSSNRAWRKKVAGKNSIVINGRHYYFDSNRSGGNV